MLSLSLILYFPQTPSHRFDFKLGLTKHVFIHNFFEKFKLTIDEKNLPVPHFHQFGGQACFKYTISRLLIK